MTQPTADQYLTMERIFDAPRELVYRAFIDPDQISQWFGPVGYSVPRDSVDVDPRPGGHQRLLMVNDADPSASSPVNATFVEVIENELLVGAEEFGGVPGLQDATTMTMRLEFHDEGDGKTRLVLRQGPFTAEMERMSREGWGSSFTKLDTLLSS
jgi:uncharacterized protein YndB with AHSA1/START domain